MKTVIFHTESAAFKFNHKRVKDHLIENKNEYSPDVVSRSLKIISTDSDVIVLSLNDHQNFGYVVLDLISTGLGSVTCKLCDQKFLSNELQSTVIGCGKGPFNPVIKRKRWGIHILKKKQELRGMFGGIGYQCPENHDLISMITWRS